MAGGPKIDIASAAQPEIAASIREVNRQRIVQAAADLLAQARSVVITPGYGMAVAQAQHPVAELTRRLRERGVEVRFGVHPVAGRLPGGT